MYFKSGMAAISCSGRYKDLFIDNICLQFERDSSKYNKVLLPAIFVGENSFNSKVGISFSLDPESVNVRTQHDGWLVPLQGSRVSVDLDSE